MKALALNTFREALWFVRTPWRTYRNRTLDQRMPSVQGRTWRSGMPPILIRSIMRGQARYTYKGKTMFRHPIDLALMLKLLHELKPKTIIEVGCKAGGTSEWLRDNSEAQVHCIDLDPPYTGTRDGITCYKGDEAHLELVPVKWKELPRPWLVINDASHDPEIMLPGLRFIDYFMEAGDYLIIEDGFVSEMGNDLGWNGGPAPAIVAFLENNPRWKIDSEYCDFFGFNVTGNPNGYIRCVA